MKVTTKVAPRCPRCGGNLFLKQELKELEWTCLQCSRTYALDAVARPVHREPATADTTRAA